MTQTTILIGLFICHWLADYTHLSTAEMLGAKRFGNPLLPILSHALTHGALMGLFLLFALNADFEKLVYLNFFQIATHFIIDTWKGRMNGWFPAIQSPANKWHWIVFGFNQLLHALVIIAMSVYTVS